MKLLFLVLFLSLSGNYPSDNGIPYRLLSWSDFRGAVPDNEPSVGARTTTQMAMEITETDGHFTYVVKAYFLPDSSFVRVRSLSNLRHEQTHFKIAYIAAKECMLALVPLQRGDSLNASMAETLYEHYVDEASRLNNRFDQETNHSLNPEAEKAWENRISLKLRTFEIAPKTPHGRNRKNP